MEKEKDLRKSFRTFALVVLVLAAAFFILRKDNVFRWIEAEKTIKAQKKQIRELEMQIDKLENQKEQLMTNKDSLEKFARENFLFSEKDEDVYIVE